MNREYGIITTDDFGVDEVDVMPIEPNTWGLI